MAIFRRLRDALSRPEYIYRPTNIARRAAFALTRSPQRRTVHTCWGARLEVDPRDTIGRAVASHGLYELPVCEVMYRLLRAGDRFVDVGANIGVMTSLAIRCVAPGGSVVALEPNRELFPVLQRNAENSPGAAQLARLVLLPYAASDCRSRLFFELPRPSSENTGLGRVADSGESDTEHNRRKIEVESFPLDMLLGDGQPVRLVKIDVEGHEYAVLSGMRRLLQSGTVEAIIVEEHGYPPTKFTELLRALGFKQYFIRCQLGGLILHPIEKHEPPRGLSARYIQNILAVRKESLMDSLRQNSWNVLRYGSFLR